MFVFGFFLSLSFGFFSGASILTIFLRALFSGLTMLALTLVIYFILDITIPEVNQLLQNSQTKNQEETEPSFSDLSSEDLADDMLKENAKEDHFQEDSYTPQITEKVMKESKKNRKVAEDEMLVEGVAIKKDPELMKNAMRQVLDQDE